MIPSTVVGVIVLVAIVLPGLAYTLAFERQAGDFGATLADRSLRFIAVSVIYHVVAGWPEYWLYRVARTADGSILGGQFALLWVGVVISVAVPLVIGTYLGRLYGRRSQLGRWRRRMLNLALGPGVAPRAWDDLFSERPDIYLRVRTIDGSWLGGLFASKSYAAGFPQDTDLLLEEAYQVDPSTGELGEPLGYPLYIAAGQITWMEIIRPEGDEGP